MPRKARTTKISQKAGTRQRTARDPATWHRPNLCIARLLELLNFLLWLLPALAVCLFLSLFPFCQVLESLFLSTRAWNSSGGAQGADCHLSIYIRMYFCFACICRCAHCVCSCCHRWVQVHAHQSAWEWWGTSSETTLSEFYIKIRFLAYL